MSDEEKLKILADRLGIEFPFGDEPINLRSMILIVLWTLYAAKLLKLD